MIGEIAAIGEEQTQPRRVTVWRGFFGQQAWSGHAFSRTRLVERRPLTALDIATRWRASLRRNWTTSTRPTRGFNGTAGETIRSPRETFAGRALSRFGDQNWWIVRFNAVGFLLTGLFEVEGLRRTIPQRERFSHDCEKFRGGHLPYSTYFVIRLKDNTLLYL